MLYKTKYGTLLDEQELNTLDPLEIEDQGIHMIDETNFWREEA